MSRNIKYQFYNAIELRFDGGGKDKHSDKAKGERLKNVYSFAERRNLIDTSALLANYTQSNAPGIRYLKDIDTSIIQSFVNSIAVANSQATIGQYISRIHKLEHIVNETYNLSVDWKTDIITPAAAGNQQKVRSVAMSRSDYMRILNHAYSTNSRSKAVIAIELAGRFATRVCETCKVKPNDIDIVDMTLHIHESKGGRSRDIPIKESDRDYLLKITKGLKDTDRIVDIEEDSVNRYLGRVEETLGIREAYKDACTGIHSIRKMVAQELYNSCREKGMSRKETINYVSMYLGHSREDIVKEYVITIW